jgi:hypothetical protein
MHEGAFVTSTYDISELRFPKFYKDIRIPGLNLTATTLSIDYQTGADIGTDTWTALPTTSYGATYHITDINLGGYYNLRFRIRFNSISDTAPPIVETTVVNGNIIEYQKYQWAMTVAVESDGDDLQGGQDTDPDTLQAALKTWAANRTKLTVSSQKNSIHGKIVTTEAPTMRMSSIDTEEGSSKWMGTLWFTLREA